MSFNLVAILPDADHGLTLAVLENRLLDRIASDPDRSEITYEPGPPPHLRLTWRETDMGTSGEWFALIFIESGDQIVVENRAAVSSSSNPCPNAEGVYNSSDRVRILFHDDPDQEYTNTMVELMTFLKRLPSSVIYDPQQNRFGL